MPWRTLCGFPPTSDTITLRIPNGAWRPDTVVTDYEGTELFVLLDQTQEMRSYEAIFGDLEGRRLVCIKRHLIAAFWRDGYYFCTYTPNYKGQAPLSERDMDNKRVYPFSYLQVSPMKGRFFYRVFDNQEGLSPPKLKAENPWLGYMIVMATPLVRTGKWTASFMRNSSSTPTIHVDQWRNCVDVGPGNDLLAALCMAYVFDRFQCQPLVTVFGLEQDTEQKDPNEHADNSSIASNDDADIEGASAKPGLNKYQDDPTNDANRGLDDTYETTPSYHDNDDAMNGTNNPYNTNDANPYDNAYDDATDPQPASVAPSQQPVYQQYDEYGNPMAHSTPLDEYGNPIDSPPFDENDAHTQATRNTNDQSGNINASMSDQGMAYTNDNHTARNAKDDQATVYTNGDLNNDWQTDDLLSMAPTEAPSQQSLTGARGTTSSYAPSVDGTSYAEPSFYTNDTASDDNWLRQPSERTGTRDPDRDSLLDGGTRTIDGTASHDKWDTNPYQQAQPASVTPSSQAGPYAHLDDDPSVVTLDPTLLHHSNMGTGPVLSQPASHTQCTTHDPFDTATKAPEDDVSWLRDDATTVSPSVMDAHFKQHQQRQTQQAYTDDYDTVSGRSNDEESKIV